MLSAHSSTSPIRMFWVADGLICHLDGGSCFQEVSAAYMKESFQKKMDAVFEKSECTDDEKESEA